MALKPLVFALAAVMAMAAQANDNDHDGGHGHHHHGPKGPTWEQQLSIDSAASAYVGDTQDSSGNSVLNQGTENTANADNSLNGSNGNMGANVAGGDGNQQDNAAALATADESFIFGSAEATSTAYQYNTNNYVKNRSTQNNATLDNAGNNGSGNIGINVTAGNFNQQKNNLAIAVSGGRVATASADAYQSTTGLDVKNKADRTHITTTLTDTTTSSGTFKAHGTGTIEDDGWDHRRHDDDKFKFTAVGTFDLSSVTTHQVLTPDGWKNPVMNNASMSGSMNGFSGNGGANVSAGAGNQQSNSLSIAAGCRACM
jgi:hypothetical protein